MMRLRIIVATLVGAVLATLPAASAAGPSWSGTWATSQGGAIPVGPWQTETLRMVARTSVAGDSIRIDLANPYVTTAAMFARVSVGVQQNGGTTTAAPTPVLFGGASSVTVPAGGTVSSDPVALPVAADTRLLVSLYIPPSEPIATAPIHAYSLETEYNYQGGDATGDRFFPTTNTFGFTAFLAGVDVDTAAPSTVVAIGDSIAAGMGTSSNIDDTWAEYLAGRVADVPLGVVNMGVTGDQVIADQPGDLAVTSRWSRDVLQVPGVRTVIEEGGVNDLRAGVSAAGLESAQASLIASAHAAGVRVLLSTLTPCGGVAGAPCDAAFEAQRLAYNTWVRGGGSGADAIVDFDAALGGYSSGGVGILNPVYDCGDHIHPNAAGNAVMANVIPVGVL